MANILQHSDNYPVPTPGVSPYTTQIPVGSAVATQSAKQLAPPTQLSIAWPNRSGGVKAAPVTRPSILQTLFGG